MQAIVQDEYGDASVLQLREVPRPTIGADGILVRVKAAGVDPGVWHLMTGLPKLMRMGTGLRSPKNPTPGMDVAGIVEEVGANVTEFAVGDAVFGSGRSTFAEFAVSKASSLVAKPANLSFEEAAAVPVSATTALQAVRGRFEPGASVLVIGAGGGVGSYAVQLTKHLGAHVTGVCGTHNVERVTKLGADEVIDYTAEDFLVGERRFDLIVDTAGNRPTKLVRRVLTERGTLVLVGGEGGGEWLGGFHRQLLAGAASPFLKHTLVGLIALTRKPDLEYLAGLLASGAIVDPLERSYPLAEAADAVRQLAKGHARGKVVLTV